MTTLARRRQEKIEAKVVPPMALQLRAAGGRARHKKRQIQVRSARIGPEALAGRLYHYSGPRVCMWQVLCVCARNARSLQYREKRPWPRLVWFVDPHRLWEMRASAR